MSVHKPSIDLHTLIFLLQSCDFSKCINFYISFETYIYIYIYIHIHTYIYIHSGCIVMQICIMHIYCMKGMKVIKAQLATEDLVTTFSCHLSRNTKRENM